MKKVIILSYFYSPSNFVGTERIVWWANNLHKYGIYPIIITRQWNQGQKDIVDKVKNNKLEIEKTDKYEIHKLPYNQNLRDKLSDYPKLKYLQKALSLYELLFSNFFIKAIPYNNIYYYAQNYLKANEGVSILMASGRPFHLFYFGYLLKKQFPIKWIPDYRDEWITHQNSDFNKSFLTRLVANFESKVERKWTSNADSFISVNEYCVNRISKFIDKPGFVIMNGYNEFKPLNPTLNDNELRIVYAGTLYESQKIELIIKSCIELNENLMYNGKIHLIFVGTEVQVAAHNKLVSLISGHSGLFEIIPRLPRNELNNILSNADLLLLTGYENVSGCYPVKLFEYFATSKPILLFPSDNNVMEDFIKEIKSGFIVNSVKEGVELLTILLDQKLKGNKITIEPDSIKGFKYSREHQTMLLGEYLNNF